MRISIYWFRTRKENNKYRSLITINSPKKAWSTACQCDFCGIKFNRTFEAAKFGFEKCDKCAMSEMNKTMFTDEVKQKISIGSSNWHAKDENKQLVSDIARNRYKDEEYAEKHKEACKERSSNEEYRFKLKLKAAKGIEHSIKTSCGLRKIDRSLFTGFITEQNKIDRQRCKMQVSSICFKNADYTCDICKVRGGKLNAHHLDGWNWCIEKRFDLDNLVCLCHGCHSGFHKKYNNRDNTRKQYEEYKFSKIEG